GAEYSSPDMTTLQHAISLAGVTVQPGSIAGGAIDIGSQPGASIAFSVAHGTTAGPVLLLVAGVHGMEYVPVVALQRLRASLDPTQLAGTVVMVHAANGPSFFGRTIYYSP